MIESLRPTPHFLGDPHGVDSRILAHLEQRSPTGFGKFRKHAETQFEACPPVDLLSRRKNRLACRSPTARETAAATRDATQTGYTHPAASHVLTRVRARRTASHDFCVAMRAQSAATAAAACWRDDDDGVARTLASVGRGRGSVVVVAYLNTRTHTRTARDESQLNPKSVRVRVFPQQ